MYPEIFLKSAVHQLGIFKEAVKELAEEGIKISGVEIQLLGMERPQEIREAVKKFSKVVRKVAIHPPFPTLLSDVVKDYSLYKDYFYVVAHAEDRNLRKFLGAAFKARSAGKIVVENVTKKKNLTIASPLLVSRFVPRLVLDIPHLLFSIDTGRLPVAVISKLSTLEGKIKVVHTADNYRGMGAVPKGKPSKGFLSVLEQLFSFSRLPVFVMEPFNGHLNNFQGHKEMARAFVRIAEEYF